MFFRGMQGIFMYQKILTIGKIQKTNIYHSDYTSQNTDNFFCDQYMAQLAIPLRARWPVQAE